MGRPPLPTRLKILHGETREGRLNRAEPRPRARLPKLPRDMGDPAKIVWRRVMREYGHAGVLTGADADILRAYCEAVARYQYAAKLLDTSGPLIRGARGGELVKSPLHQVVRDNAVLMKTLARELGLTPAARTSLRGEPEETVDPFAAFLDGTG